MTVTFTGCHKCGDKHVAPVFFSGKVIGIISEREMIVNRVSHLYGYGIGHKGEYGSLGVY